MVNLLVDTPPSSFEAGSGGRGRPYHHALFAVTAVAHVAVVVHAILRSRIRPAIATADKDNYTTAPTATAPLATPESLMLDPRAPADGEAR